MKVSVIIPIYNVALFIQRCAVSLMMQTLDEVEFIFVDDCTPDNSMEILRGVLERFPQRTIRIIHHEKNKGLPTARNSGLAVAQGEFIFHCDSDDYMETNMLETLYTTAQKADADVVWCDWYMSFAQNERYMKVPNYATSDDALRGMLSGAMKYNVWNKLVRRSLYTDYNVRFPEGHSMGEDMTMIRLFVHVTKVAYVPQALYHYVRVNNGSFTNTHSQKQLDDILFNAEQTIDYIRAQKGAEWERHIAYFKLEVKLPFLISEDFTTYNIWKLWFPEANRYIMHNHALPLRTRLLQFAAAKGQFWLVRLYNLLVIKLVYDILYK